LLGNPLPGEPPFHLLPKLVARLLQAPGEGRRVEARRGPAPARPFGDLAPERPTARPLGVRIADHEGKTRRVRDLGAIARERHDGDRRAPAELPLDELPDRGLHLGLFVQARRSFTAFRIVAL